MLLLIVIQKKYVIGINCFIIIDNSDLKPENFLLKYKNDITSIKLIDFGLSKKLTENEIMT